MKSEESIDEFLSMTAKRDLQGRYIVPKEDVRARLEKEVQRRTQCSPANLTPDAKELSKWPASAEPQKFVGDTLDVIEKISTTLKQEKAKKFEIRFINPDRDPRRWGDQILIGVRYLT